MLNPSTDNPMLVSADQFSIRRYELCLASPFKFTDKNTDILNKHK